ncbi:DUF5696 domain-containing protein [Paenibacillus sp. J5C_2022]|nr:DUF5696 domain-containing protein [Paenibacillus sp. J5C2022]
MQGIKHKAIPIGSTIVVVLLLVFVLGKVELGDNEITADSLDNMEEMLAERSFQKEPLAAPIVNYGDQVWHLVAEQVDTTLWIDYATGQIMIDREQHNEKWLSNPVSSSLKEETAKGLWLESLKSPFVFYYLVKNDVNVKVSNTVEFPLEMTWTALTDGIGVLYDIPSLGFKFYIEYVLENGQFVAHIPEYGIAESGDNQLVSIELLPFFGAGDEEANGSILVPDGPGGLIHLKKSSKTRKPYSYPVYDHDASISGADRVNRSNRDGIAYPVFGMATEEKGFIAVIEKGEARANIVAGTSGMRNSYNFVYASFSLRYPYMKPKGLGRTESSYEKNIAAEPRTIRYLWSDSEREGYSALAETFRNYLIEHVGMQRITANDASPKLYFNIAIGSTEKTSLGNKYVSATTFTQAERMVQGLLDTGISNMEVGLSGWQNGGYLSKAPKRLPIPGKSGGKADFDKFQSFLADKGIELRLDDTLYFAADRSGTGFQSRTEAVKGIDGLTVKGKANEYSRYFISPQVVEQKYVNKAMNDYAALTVKRVGIEDGGSGLHSDYSSKHWMLRGEVLASRKRVLENISKQTESLTVTGAGMFALPYADHIFQMPMSSNYDLIIDEQVPFYPMALHGLVSYSSIPGNWRDDPIIEFLRDLEYGAAPNYFVTEAPPDVLQNTYYNGLYSSEFEILLPQILEEYQAYQAVQQEVMDQYIVHHRRLAADVYETEYENGKKVWVNYSDKPFRLLGELVEPYSYKVTGGDNEKKS